MSIWIVAFGLVALVSGQSIVNTVHNLSALGPGTIKAVSEPEICIFCHTPHRSKPISPLWNRDDPGANYTLYNTSTVEAAIDQPDGSSIMCLSCHDGTIALGHVLSRNVDIDFSAGVTTLPPGNTNLSTDLADDHPISFAYTSALATSDGQLKDPANITWPVFLENGRVQCISCHDPHDDTNEKFLIASPKYSDLCVSCHDRTYWNNSSHKTSTNTWNGSGNDPWFHTSYTTVEENACENCHNPHNAEGEEWLMNNVVEENNCIVCHSGNVATKNIETEINKTYSHDVMGYYQIHDPAEDAVVAVQHVECRDCHNPHAANNDVASAPDANGYIKGVRGVDQNGNEVDPIQYEYELCYRCHADSPNKPISQTTRQIEQNNVRLEFASTNPSFHPVTVVGQNNDVPSLIAPLSESSILYCTACHASNGSGAPNGPHGSIYPSLLKYNYETAMGTPESYAAYELCYQCHSRTSVLNDDSFKEHDKHISGEKTPCNICHDPHGINSTQGNNTNNTHLINFDVNEVSPWNGQLKFEDTGQFHGKCYLTCHGKEHKPKSY
ncbi:MAG: cytochrome c3 family protein [Fidelibacterota bacterium]